MGQREPKLFNQNKNNMAKKLLQPLYLQALHHPEFGQLLVRYFSDFASRNLDASKDADFAAVHNALQQKLPEYNAALDQVRGDENSRKIAEADRHRDDDFQSLKNALKSYRTSRRTDEKDAFLKMANLLNGYKNLEADNYEQETNRMNTLIQRLQSPEFSMEVTTLGVAKFVSNLSESNQQFEELFAHRSTQGSQKVSYNVKAVRKALTGEYTRLCNYVATMADMKSDPFYKNALEVVNQGRKYFADVVLARRNGDAEVSNEAQKAST